VTTVFALSVERSVFSRIKLTDAFAIASIEPIAWESYEIKSSMSISLA
jgi:hypothetical protein